ncbi:MAG: hypothetical protein ABI867_26755 [Kofleriaceae bacterium]
MRFAILVVVFGGCTWVYDSQYDDRASELEEARSEFLPGSEQVKFLSQGTKKLYWVNLAKPLDKERLHSFDPATNAQLDYTFTNDESNLDENYTFGDSLIARCSFGTSKVFDATQPNTQISSTTLGEDNCAVDGNAVYFEVANEIRKWVPTGAGDDPVKVVDLTLQGVGQGTGAFAATGNTMVYAEGSRVWHIALDTGIATWLENDNQAIGQAVFDEVGVAFQTQNGVDYIKFSDHSRIAVEDAIADGGYKLNYKNDDIQDLASTPEMVIFEKHLIYRSVRGIFALGLESGKVTDLLLDRGESFETKPSYHSPVVTSDGTLFVQDRPFLNSSGDDQPVYRVDLTDRLH